MQPIDPHTLFSIFEKGDEEIYKEHASLEALKNPFVLMGTVLRGIENYYLMDVMYARSYPDEYKKVRKLTKLKYFNNLFRYLKKIDISNPDRVYRIGESFDRESTVRGLDVLRVFYEKLEHYEKCAVIKKYIDLVTTSPKLTFL
jgi:hypothetical protein